MTCGCRRRRPITGIEFGHRGPEAEPRIARFAYKCREHLPGVRQHAVGTPEISCSLEAGKLDARRQPVPVSHLRERIARSRKRDRPRQSPVRTRQHEMVAPLRVERQVDVKRAQDLPRPGAGRHDDLVEGRRAVFRMHNHSRRSPLQSRDSSPLEAHARCAGVIREGAHHLHGREEMRGLGKEQRPRDRRERRLEFRHSPHAEDVDRDPEVPDIGDDPAGLFDLSRFDIGPQPSARG